MTARRHDRNPVMVYQIRLEGHLDAHWSNWFENAIIVLEAEGTTLLTLRVVDQAALYGVLRKVRDLGMTLLMARCVEPGELDESDR